MHFLSKKNYGIFICISYSRSFFLNTAKTILLLIPCLSLTGKVTQNCKQKQKAKYTAHFLADSKFSYIFSQITDQWHYSTWKFFGKTDNMDDISVELSWYNAVSKDCDTWHFITNTQTATDTHSLQSNTPTQSSKSLTFKYCLKKF